MSGKSGNYFALLSESDPPAKTAPAPKPATTNAAPAKQQGGNAGAAPAKAGGVGAAKGGQRKDPRTGHEKTRENKDRERKGPYKGRGRQFDKQSHSGTKQGAVTDKRGGAGKANWGTQEDDLKAQTAPVAADETEAVPEVAAEGAPVVPTEEDEDAKLVSYDEFLKKSKGGNVARATPARKAGDGVENKDWEKFVPVAKKEGDGPVFIGVEEGEKAAVPAPAPKAAGKQKKAKPAPAADLLTFRIAEKPRAPREGREGRPPRGDGERPPRADGDRPPRRPREDRPPKEGAKDGEARPPRAERPPRGAAKGGERPPRGAPKGAPKGAAKGAPKGGNAAGAGLKVDDSSFPALS